MDFKRKRTSQIDTLILVNQRQEGDISMTVRSRREAAALQVKTKCHSTKVSF